MNFNNSKVLSCLALISAAFGANLSAFGAESFSCPAGTVAQTVDATAATDFVSATETQGPISGQINGSAGCYVLGAPEPQADRSIVLKSQAFIHTSKGDITFAPGAATAVLVGGTPEAPLLAVRDYPIQVTGGTGIYAGVKTGLFNHIGAIDMRDPNHGKNVFRISGVLCYSVKH